MNETVFLTRDARLDSYISIPRAVLELPLSSTELLLYALLLDRARLSQREARWADQQGRVFLFYPLSALAADLGRTEMTVKRGLNRLEALGLLYRSRQGACRANKLYVKVPAPQAGVEDAPEASAPEAAERQDFDRLLEKKRAAAAAEAAARAPEGVSLEPGQRISEKYGIRQTLK